MTKKELAQWATRHGYTEKRGNWYKTRDGKEYRIKVQPISMRMEGLHVYTTTDCFTGQPVVNKIWVKLRAGYLKDITINDVDKLHFAKLL